MIYAALNVTNNSTAYYKFSRYSPLADSDIIEDMSTYYFSNQEKVHFYH